MKHYDILSRFFDLDESNWDFMLNIAYDRLKKNIKKYDSWYNLANQLSKEYKEDSEHENIGCFAQIVYGAESSFYNESPDFSVMGDCELVAHFAQSLNSLMDILGQDADKEAIESEKIIQILNSLGNGYNSYIRYYEVFSAAVTDVFINIEEVKKSIVKLSQIYTDDINVSNDITCAFAMVSMIEGNVKKGSALFEHIIENDKFNLELYIRYASVLDYCEEYDQEINCLEKAINISEELEEEDLAESFQDLINDILKRREKPYEIFTSKGDSLLDIFENPSDYENLEKALLDVIMAQHPDYADDIYNSNDEGVIASAYEHFRKHAGVCMDIIQKSEKKKEFMNLLKSHREHEAIHIMLGEKD